jgi:copper chaperone CopZ/quercetin dioxygenase-like cupin family protein
MKRYIVLFGMALLYLQLVFAQEEPKHCTLNVKGMTCGGCVSAVKSTISKLEGVKSVDVDLATGRAEIVYASAKLSPDDVISAINKTGFSASIAEEPQKPEKKYPVDITKEMGLPEGAKCHETSEFDCPVQGYSKVKIVKLTLKPGTKIESFTVPMHAFCTLVKGTLSVVTSDGKEMTVKEGDRWVDPKGTVYKVIENKGKSIAEDTMFMLAEAQTEQK